MGDERTYEYTAAIRAVESRDGMTADWARLHMISSPASPPHRHEVRGINRVVYDISSKPRRRSSGNDGDGNIRCKNVRI